VNCFKKEIEIKKATFRDLSVAKRKKLYKMTKFRISEIKHLQLAMQKAIVNRVLTSEEENDLLNYLGFCPSSNNKVLDYLQSSFNAMRVNRLPLEVKVMLSDLWWKTSKNIELQASL